MAKKLQEQKFLVLRPIRYHNPDSPLYRKRLTPADNELVDFPHLSDNDIKLLMKVRLIAKASPADVKAVDAAKAKAKNAKQDEINKAAKAQADAKANAMAKMLKSIGE